MNTYYPEGWKIGTPENSAALQTPSALQAAWGEGKILEARATLCDSAHNLVVDLGCMKGLIPREEGALGIREGTARDIAIISRVNRPVCFLIQGFFKEESGETAALLSRRAAQEECRRRYVSSLRPGDVIRARITHLEAFGAFADIGCGVVALLPIDAISVSRIDHPRERFAPGMDIFAVVKSIDGNRVNLTHKELLGTWEENAAQFHPGETVAGVVRSVEPYGVFVELTPNLAGLAESREGAAAGQQASVYIKSILPGRMKVKLILIDTFHYTAPPEPPRYFFHGKHIDRFVYSPAECGKVIATDFASSAVAEE